ncbi:MAG: indolepyruvate ferredoxin oxidoreductase subunit alpha, partial [Chloroflexi bacterium]|nr:indolepyruvate ferredoxin oxidoreductase subunit alpha [Chloroflexota bacterium]
MVATAYPGTPSTEILEELAKNKDIKADWANDERVAFEIALGASYAGARSIVSMKHVGLNVASDPFMSASTTGVNAGMVLVSADDPGMHSSQGEQDNRYYAKFAKIPLLEPSDSQEAYDLMTYAFDISENFDTPVMIRPTTRLSHAKTVVNVSRTRNAVKQNFHYAIQKYVLLPVFARARRPFMEERLKIEERLKRLSEYSESFPLNQVFLNSQRTGIISSGIAYQYAREVFGNASFLKLSMSYPLPEKLIRDFARHVDKLLVIEELEPFLQENITNMGIKVTGKEFVPNIGELTPEILEAAAYKAGLLKKVTPRKKAAKGLPQRPPLLCPGCPHTGIFYLLSNIGRRVRPGKASGELLPDSDMVICGDIGCYTLATYPPLCAMDTTTCMGASIGTALGMEKAGLNKKIVAVLGDSTFLHSGVTGLMDAVYFQSKITIIILDNSTTAMTGHQQHPGTGITAQGQTTNKVILEDLVRGCGVDNVCVIDAFNMKTLKETVRDAINSDKLSVIIVRGQCAVMLRSRSEPKAVATEKCNDCGICLLLGCPAIQKNNNKLVIEPSLCCGGSCGICQQICPRKAIMASSEVQTGKIS